MTYKLFEHNRVKKFFKKLKTDKVLQRLYWIEFFKGINRSGVAGLVASLIIIRTLSNDTALGDWSAVFEALSVLAMLLFAKYYKKADQTATVILSVTITILSTILIIIFPSFISVVIYNISCSVFLHIIEKISSANLFNYSTKGKYGSIYNTEYFTYREIFLNAGRVVGYLVLIILALSGTINEALNIMFIIIVISVVIMSGLIIRTKEV